jgi:exodeoxyribonuclease V beta subunit
VKTLAPESLTLTGTTLIEASAGTGKTYTITTLVLRLLLEARLDIEQILVVTYTRAATAELRDRIRTRLALALRASRGERTSDPFVQELVARARAEDSLRIVTERLERALYDVDRAPVLTIHGFCQRVLSDHAFACGALADVKLTAHSAPLLEEISDDYYVRELHAASEEQVLALDRREPEKLRALAARAAHGEELRVLPEQLSEATFDPAAWRSALHTCRELFQQDRELIAQTVGLLAKGQQRHVPTWSLALERAFRTATPGFSSDHEAALRNFSRSGLLAKAKTQGAAALHPFFTAADELRAQEARFLASASAARLHFRRNFLRYVDGELSLRTERDGVRTFDALLRDVNRAISGPMGEALSHTLASEYRAALVDEFQDTDPLQYRIFHRVFARSPLFLIGDPKQAIYGFRGADVFAYMAARDQAGERTFTLTVNRRSDSELIAALNALYARVTRPFALDGIDYIEVSAPEQLAPRFRSSDGGAPVELLVVDGEGPAELLRKSIAERVAGEIKRLLESASERLDEHDARFRRLKPRDIAVLCRTNREAQLIESALSERKIPSVFQGDESVLESDDAIELERVLRALAHPGDARALRAFLSSFYAGFTGGQLDALERDDRGWDEHRARLTRLHDLWLEHGFMQAIRGLVMAYDVERVLLSRPDGTRRMTNLWHLCELLSAASIEQRLGPVGLIRFLSLVRTDDVLRSELVGDAHELRLESSEDAVKLTTVHKSKGLEYPVVFLPFAWETRHVRGEDANFVRFHDASGALALDLGSDELKENLAQARLEGLAESLRLLYVGLTRAMHRVYAVAPAIKDFAESALGYSLLGGSALPGTPPGSPATGQELYATLSTRLDAKGIRVRMLPEATREPLRTYGATPQLEVRAIRRRLDESHRTSSFSALSARAHTAHDAGHDHDEVDAGDEPPQVSPLVLDTFPRGAGPGQLVHELFEELDFASDESAIRLLAEQVLTPRGYAPALAETLARGVTHTLATRLDEAGLALAHIPRARRLDELEFLLPVRSELTPRKLEQVLKKHGAPVADPAYAARVRALSFESLTGFLRGFIDLVFEHEGRFFVVDYKSNRLGPEPSDYARERMAEAMGEHHYYLQYLLYVVAVHRYLRQRLPGYDYELHMGGVYYLFLRGMHPAHDHGTGVFFDRPTRALIDDLDRALSGEAEAP